MNAEFIVPGGALTCDGVDEKAKRGVSKTRGALIGGGA